MKSNLPVLILVGLTFAATLFVAVNQDTSPPVGDDDRLAEIEDRLDRLEVIAKETRDDARRAARAASTRRTAPSPEPSVATARDANRVDEAVAALDAPDLKQVVAESVQKTVEEQMERMAAEKRHRGWDGKWKPPIKEMAKALDLSDPQREALEGIFDGARDEAYALLATQRDDGGNLLDDFVRDLRESEDEKQPWTRLFAAITTKRVPGRNQTYLEAFGEAEGRIREQVGARLDAAQMERFGALNVDVFDVQTGYDPVGQYVKDRLGESAE